MNEENTKQIAENANPEFKKFDLQGAELVADYLLCNVPDEYRECSYTSKKHRFYMFVSKNYLNGGADAPQVFKHNLCAFMATNSKKPVTEKECRDKNNKDVHLCIWKHSDETQGYHGYLGMLCKSKYERF